MGYNSYDDWKLANPYDEYEGEYVPVEVEVLIFDLGQNIIDDFKNDTSKISFEDEGTTLTTTIKVNVIPTRDDFENECYVEEEDVENAVAEYLGKGCDYEIIDWRMA